MANPDIFIRSNNFKLFLFVHLRGSTHKRFINNPEKNLELLATNRIEIVNLGNSNIITR